MCKTQPRARGVTKEDYDSPGMKTVIGIAAAGGREDSNTGSPPMTAGMSRLRRIPSRL